MTDVIKQLLGQLKTEEDVKEAVLYLVEQL